jgi:hypothetical protein
MGSTSILRSVIRGLLREEAGAGKSQELIQEITWINSLLSDAGVDAQMGILISHVGIAATITFALGSRSRPDLDSVIRLERRNNNVFEALARVHSQSEKFEKNSDIIQRLEAARSDDAMYKVMSEKIHTLVPAGSIRIYPASSITSVQNGPCGGAWFVNITSSTTSGWGPLLYDIAIEWASMNGGVGLVSDREIVSPDAARVWGVYSDPSRRRDVTSTQLDIRKGSEEYDQIESEIDRESEELGLSDEERTKRIDSIQLTPDDDSDDCSQQSAYTQMGLNWMKSPLSRAYKKNPVVIPDLDSKGLLWK